MTVGLRAADFFEVIRLIFWVPFFLGVAYAVLRLLLVVRKFWDSGDWPTVDGKTIGPGQIKESYSERSMDYEATITYEYQVSGTSYRGTSFLKLFKKKEDAEAFLREHMPEGTPIVVHYKPEDAGTSRLELDPYEFDDDEPISLNLGQKSK